MVILLPLVIFYRSCNTQYFPDRFVRREINSLDVICPFFNDGCDWEGKFEEYSHHENRCCFQPMPDVQVFPINASPTQSLNGALGQTHELVQLCHQCPLSPLGCKTEHFMDSRELEQHLQENEQNHFAILTKRIQVLDEKLQGKNLAAYVPHNSKLNAQRIHQDHPLSEKTRFQYHVVPPVPQLGNEINNLISDNMQRIRNLFTEELQARDEEIASLKSRVMKLEGVIRSKNAELEDRDFRLSLIENSNHDGSMIWKIPQFSERKADAVNGKYTSIFSLPFYSGRYGYKMCLRLYIMGDGIGKGTHLSLFFVVMRGEFDTILQWPFTHKVTFKLLNQAGGRGIVDTFQPDPMSSSFRKPKSDMNVSSGCPRFVSHAELERGGFIVDDTIFIKCMIDTSTIRHP